MMKNVGKREKKIKNMVMLEKIPMPENAQGKALKRHTLVPALSVLVLLRPRKFMSSLMDLEFSSSILSVDLDLSLLLFI
jgi:hypothetical protein